MAHCFTFHRVLVVTDISTGPNPPFAVFLGINLRIHQRPHAMIIKRIRLEQVNNVKPVSTSSNCVLKSEVIPLGVSTSVVVRFQY